MWYVIDPVEANNREEYGHYEVDTIWGKRPSTSCLVTIIERKTRYLYAVKLSTRKSSDVVGSIISILKALSPKSITMDRGKEFSMFMLLEEQLKCDVYFSDLGCPYQRGSIENANGLLRQYFPKGTDFGSITHKELAQAVEEINERPRMIFQYVSSRDMLALEI